MRSLFVILALIITSCQFTDNTVKLTPSERLRSPQKLNTYLSRRIVAIGNMPLKIPFFLCNIMCVGVLISWKRMFNSPKTIKW